MGLLKILPYCTTRELYNNQHIHQYSRTLPYAYARAGGGYTQHSAVQVTIRNTIPSRSMIQRVLYSCVHPGLDIYDLFRLGASTRCAICKIDHRTSYRVASSKLELRPAARSVRRLGPSALCWLCSSAATISPTCYYFTVVRSPPSDSRPSSKHATAAHHMANWHKAQRLFRSAELR